MTDKQKQFCEEYVLSKNVIDSAIKAGYSKKSAQKNSHKYLKQPHIIRYIENLTGQKNHLDVATPAEVLETITSIMRDQSESTRDRLTAAEKLAKRYSLFTEQPEPDNKLQITLSEELDKLAE